MIERAAVSRQRGRAPLYGLAMALAFVPAAHAACTTELGHGWPPAVGNYGQAVETLFVGKAQPMLSLVTLPKGGVETGVALLPGTQDQVWTLRFSKADKRVYTWNNSARGGGVELRVDQEPDQYQVAIPAALAQRLVRSWRSALDSGVPAERKAPIRVSPSDRSGSIWALTMVTGASPRRLAATRL